MAHEITTNEIHNIEMKKMGNRVQVVYEGGRGDDRRAVTIGFSFMYRAVDEGGLLVGRSKFRDEFELYLVEKGLYRNGML
jgi:hypothetical protein